MALLFHDLLTLKSFDCLSTCEQVIIEVPPLQGANAKFQIRSVVDKMVTKCPNVTLIVQPSYRPRTDRVTWLTDWNADDTYPFRFHQTCSCRCLGGHGRVAGSHVLYYLGSTVAALQVEPCTEVPMAQAVRSVLTLGLEDVLCHILDTAPDPPRSRGAQRVPDSKFAHSHQTSASSPREVSPPMLKKRRKLRRSAFRNLGLRFKSRRS